jgi:hypothetical protein
MFKKCISSAVTIIGMSAFVWLAACSSSSKSNKDAGLNPDASQTNNDGGASLAACYWTAYCTNPPTCKPSAYCESPLRDGGSGSLTICSGAATEATIDDMTAPTITFTPPSCATKGEWSTYAGGTGTITPPDSKVFVYSALPDPAGLPAGVLAASDAGDSGLSGPKAACASGSTDTVQYHDNDLGVQFGNSILTDGGTSAPALIDASAYTGVQFWLWTSASTASAVSENLVVQLGDKKESPIFGICNPRSVTTQLGCGAAGAGVSGSSAAVTFGSGTIPGVDGGNATIVAGWQLIKIPFVNFAINPYDGIGNETALDTTTLSNFNFVIFNSVAAAVAFDFCVYDLAFYH